MTENKVMDISKLDVAGYIYLALAYILGWMLQGWGLVIIAIILAIVVFKRKK